MLYDAPLHRMVLSDGYVKIKVRVIGNARMLVEKGSLVGNCRLPETI